MLLRHAWLPIGAGLIAAGWIWTSAPVLALGLFVLLAGALARRWADHALDDVEFERRLPEPRAFPGERIPIRYGLANRKRLPLPRVEVRDVLPEALAPEPSTTSLSGVWTYGKTTHLGGHERVSWTLELPCSQRGYSRLGPARLSSGDVFGLFKQEREDETTAGVVVYPRTVTLPDLGLPSARPLGERKGRQRIFEDPLRIAGLRDYEPGDSIRRVDWKATARSGRLQSRVYEPSATQHLIVALNIDTMLRPWEGYLPEVLEESIVAAASIARWAFDERYGVGLVANGSLPESDRPIRIPPGRAPDHLSRILEALGGIVPLTLSSLADVLERESHQFPFGATIAVVTAIMSEPLAGALRRLRESGQQVIVLATADGDWSALLGSVPVQRLQTPEPLAERAT